MTGTATGRLPAAASHADAAEQALSKARDRYAIGPAPIYVDWVEAVTHGLLAVASAIEDAGTINAGTVAEPGERLGAVDDTLVTVASEIAGTAAGKPASRWRRLHTRRRTPLQSAS